MLNTPNPWWIEEDQELALVLAHTAAMRLWNGYGQDMLSRCEDALTLYFGNRAHSVGGLSMRATLDMALGIASDPQAQNLVQMVTDTMASHMMKDRVRPFFLTTGGSAEQREKAKGMMEATEGVFFQNDAYGELGQEIIMHGLLFHGGFGEVIPDYTRHRCTISVMPPWEWQVPPEEGKNPRQGYRIFTMDRWQALEDFGYDVNEDGERVKNDTYELIESAPCAPPEMILQRLHGDDTVSDRIMVIESFHLASGYVDIDNPASFGLNEDGELDDEVDPGHDGVRMLQIGDKVLLTREPWPHDDFNKVKFMPSRNPSDYWGRGVAETLAGAQLKINKLTRRIDGIMHKASVSTIIASRQSKIQEGKITNDHVKVLYVNGQPSQAVHHLTGTAPPSELFAERDRYVEWGKAQYGLNEMTLYGEKPPGVDHAPGMEHLLDEQNLRHTAKFRARDDLFVGMGKWVAECCRMLAMRDPKFEVVFGDNKRLKRIRWKDVELARSEFVVKAHAANLLPQLPGMKMKRLAELVNMGEPFASQAAMALVEDYPDVEAITGPLTAERRNIEAKLAKVATEGMSEDVIPHPYLNLDLAKSMAKAQINLLELDGDVSGMGKVIQWWEACDKLQKQLMPPPAPPMVPPGQPMAGPPGAMPPGAPQPQLMQ